LLSAKGLHWEEAVKKQTSADIAGGCFLAVLGLVTLFAASKIKGGLEERLPPRTLPYVIGSIILVSGIILAVKSLRFKGEDLPIHWPDRQGTVRILITLISLTAYIALMTPLGLPLSTFLYVTFSVWYLGRYRILYALLIGFVSGAISWLLFIYLLELSFPMGPFYS
jgi:putative tricarboxylic transport membrane protein